MTLCRTLKTLLRNTRGAALAVAVDIDARAIAALRANAAALDLPSLETVRAEARAFMPAPRD